MFGAPPNPFNTGSLMSQSPGVLRKNGQNTMAVTVPKEDRNAHVVRCCQASGSSTTTVTSDTTLPLDTLLQDTSDTPQAAKLATLDADTLTFNRAGYYLITYSATFGYSVALGTLGETMTQAKVSAQVEAGGQAMTPSKAFTTLSSRLNISSYVKITPNEESLDNIVFYHGTHQSEAVTPDSDEPPAWHGSATENGLWTVWVSLAEAGEPDLIQEASEILTNLEVREKYESKLFDVQTVNGSCLVEVVATKANEYKVKIGSTLYAGTVTIKGTVTCGGEGEVDPIVVCTACTVTLLRI